MNSVRSCNQFENKRFNHQIAGIWGFKKLILWQRLNPFVCLLLFEIESLRCIWSYKVHYTHFIFKIPILHLILYHKQGFSLNINKPQIFKIKLDQVYLNIKDMLLTCSGPKVASSHTKNNENFANYFVVTSANKSFKVVKKKLEIKLKVKPLLYLKVYPVKD